MRKSSGWRTGVRALAALSIVAVVGIVAFTGLSAYSASQIRPSPASGPSTMVGEGPNDTIVLTANVSVSNPGYFAFDHLAVSTAVWMPGPSGALLAYGGSPDVSVPAGSVGQLAVTLHIPLRSGAGAALLTEDMVLPGWAWVNATYAQVYGIALTIPRNFTWGAPFAALSISSGTPTVGANGSTTVPLEVTFHNDAAFPIGGTLAYRVIVPSGAECAAGAMPVEAEAHTGFQGGAEIGWPKACGTSGDSIALSYVGGPWNVPVVSEPFP